MNFIDRKFKQLMEQTDIDEKLRDRKGTLSRPFRWKEFATIDSLMELSSYADQRLEFMGKGSSRVVYLLSSRFVLKIAKNEAGKAQNAYEYELSQNSKIAPILARVKDAHPNGLWIVSDLVKPFKEDLGGDEEFQKLMGFDFYAMFKDGHELEQRAQRMLDNAEMEKPKLKWLEADLEAAKKEGDQEEIRRRQRRYDDAAELIQYYIGRAEELRQTMKEMDNPKLQAYRDAIEYAQEKYGLVEGGDTEYIDHWGKTPDGRAVFLDYGLSEDIYSSFY